MSSNSQVNLSPDVYFYLPNGSMDQFPASYNMTGLLAEVSEREYEAIAEESEAHFAKFTVALPRKAKLTLLAALTLRADRDVLRIFSDYLNAVFCYDDVFDGETQSAGPAAAARSTQQLMAMLRDPQNADSFHDALPQARVFCDLWTRAVKMMPGQGSIDRFLALTEQYLVGTCLESRIIEDLANAPYIVDGALDIEAYIDHRCIVAGVMPCLPFSELALGHDIPEELMRDPAVRRMERCTTEIVALSNDIYSFNKEQAAGQPTNLAVLAMTHLGLGVQAALDLVDARLQAAGARFLAEKSALSGRLGPMIDGYVRAMEDWVVGSHRWHVLSGRYFGDDAGRVKPGARCRIRLLPRRSQAAAAAGAQAPLPDRRG